MEHSFNTLLTGTREKQGYEVMRSQMDNLREQQQCITMLKQIATQPQNQPRPVSVPPAANLPVSPYPPRRPSDMRSRNQVQAENANALRKNSSDSEKDRLQDIQEKPHIHIGPSHVQQLAKFFTPSSDEENHSCVNTKTRCKNSLSQKRRREGVMKRNKLCNLNLKPKLGPLRTVLCFPERSLLLHDEDERHGV